MAKYNLILIPVGAIVPEEIRIPVAPKGDVIERIAAGREHPVILEVTTRELQALVEYRDLFDVECTAVIGLHGAMYNTIWNTYVSTMKRTTIDNLLTEQAAQLDEMSNAGQIVETNPATRRAGVSKLRFGSADETVDANDDPETGDL